MQLVDQDSSVVKQLKNREVTVLMAVEFKETSLCFSSKRQFEVLLHLALLLVKAASSNSVLALEDTHCFF